MGVYSIVANEDDDSLYYHDIKVVLDLAVNTDIRRMRLLIPSRRFRRQRVLLGRVEHVDDGYGRLR
jgi:hypothetical protein